MVDNFQHADAKSKEKMIGKVRKMQKVMEISTQERVKEKNLDFLKN